MFTVDHDRYWQSCDAGRGGEADGSSQAGAGASLGSHSAVAWPGSPVSGGGLTSVHWSHMTHVRRVWAELRILR